MNTQIYVPSSVVTMLVDPRYRSDCNPSVCMKFNIGIYAVSVSSDASLGGYGKNLTRTDIRIYRDDMNKDVTDEIASRLWPDYTADNTWVLSSVEDLNAIFTYLLTYA